MIYGLISIWITSFSVPETKISETETLGVKSVILTLIVPVTVTKALSATVTSKVTTLSWVSVLSGVNVITESNIVAVPAEIVPITVLPHKIGNRESTKVFKSIVEVSFSVILTSIGDHQNEEEGLSSYASEIL